MNDMDAFYELIKSEKPVLVEFFATWCPFSQRVHPIIEELEVKREGELIVLKYDVDLPLNRRLVEYYQIQIIPTIILFKAGEQIWRQSGDILRGRLEQVLQRNL